MRVEHSQQLHALIARVVHGEQSATSLARALYLADAPNHPHIGFAVLVPILLPEKMSGVHVYLRPDMRGYIEQFMPSLLTLAQQTIPGMRLAIMDAKPEWARMLTGYGFVQHTVFIGGGK